MASIDEENLEAPPEDLNTDDLHEMADHQVGAAPGLTPQDLEQLPSSQAPIKIDCIDYSPTQVHFQDVDDLEDFILRHRPQWATVRWINVAGLTNMDIIRALAEKYDLHPLAIEDTLHIPQRPKVETYAARGDIHGRIFVAARMLSLRDDHIHGEQVSLFLGHKTLITFQEDDTGDVFDRIRDRLKTNGSQLRENDASFLMYCLLDAIVDHCFPILEHYSDRLEKLEDDILDKSDKATISRIHDLKRELLILRRTMWPTREMISNLSRLRHECLSETTQTYLRDAYDHTVQIIDMIETYRELTNGLAETYMFIVSVRLNEIMKVLTIIATIFIPLTFLAGVYGMNFTNIPEIVSWEWGYASFWVVCILAVSGMLFWFRRRKWI
ncbi:MAG: magnesium/cobalt transporter CorA [Phycisphaerales bacterium]|nr:magnesium/cobalt transporter CorA [Phycisphaerales bacterium]